jgi:hypothetical protein
MKSGASSHNTLRDTSATPLNTRTALTHVQIARCKLHRAHCTARRALHCTCKIAPRTTVQICTAPHVHVQKKMTVRTALHVQKK